MPQSKLIEPPELTKLRTEAGHTTFGAAAVSRAAGMKLGINPKTKRRDLDLPWSPGQKRWKSAAVMSRNFLKAFRIARDAIGMLAKVDNGEMTRSGGRILTVGTVLQATAAFRYTFGSELRHILRLRDRKGRVWDEITKITAVHPLDKIAPRG